MMKKMNSEPVPAYQNSKSKYFDFTSTFVI
jgi:hypothetical protein